MASIPNINDFKGIDLSALQAVRKDIPVNTVESVPQTNGGTIKDTNSISEISKYLSEAKIDISSSNAKYDGENLDFNLTFRKNSDQYITANGSYNSQTEDFNFSMTMKFKRYVIENGVKKEKSFDAEINYNSSNMKSVSVEQSMQKEDIYKFLSRIVQRIFDLAGDDTKNLQSVTFNVNDLIDMAQMGDMKTAKMVKELINVAIFTAQLQQMIKEKAKTQEDVALVAERQVENTTTKTQSDFQTTDFSIKINESKADTKVNKTEKN